MFSPEARKNEQVFQFISFWLVAALLACAAQTFSSLLGHIYVDWQPWYLGVASFFVALNSLYSYRALKKLEPLSREWLAGLGARWLVILAALRLIIGLSNGLMAFWAELPFWASNLSVLLPGEFFLAGFVALITWLISDFFAEMLERMGLDQTLLQRELNDPVLNVQRPPRQQIFQLTLSLGTLLVVFVALMRFDLRAALAGKVVVLDLPPLAGGGASVLLYFMVGLALFSLSQLMELQTRWGLQKIPVSGQLAQQWAQYSLIFLTLLALLVSILPTSYSLGLLTSLGNALNFVFGVLFFIIQVLLGIFVFIVNLPFLIFGRKAPLETITPETPTLPQTLLPAPEIVPTVSPPWLELTKSILFWAVLLVVLALALRQTLRQHPEWMQFRFLHFLALFWGWLEKSFKKAGKNLTKMVQQGWERILLRTGQPKNGGGWINLRKLDPRRKVFFYYQAFLRRSAESGLPRSLSQTPADYASRLESALPESEADIETLTATFIEARYTRRPIEPQRASLAQKIWHRIRKVLH